MRMYKDEGTRRWRFGLAEASLALVACAAVMGWAASFVGLHDFGVRSMDGYSDFTAWFVPATFDGAAFGTTLITYRASINGRGAFRARILMWAFTAVSSWINWVHQPSERAQIVAAGLPIAAVAVFDVVMLEMRGDYEARHGRRAFRMRPGLLLLRWLVDRTGTTDAFRGQIRSIPVASLAGLGSDLSKILEEAAADTAEGRPGPAGPPATPPRQPRTEEKSSAWAAPRPWPASWPQPQGYDQPISHAVNGSATISPNEVGHFAKRTDDTTEAPSAAAHTPASRVAEWTEDVARAEFDRAEFDHTEFDHTEFDHVEFDHVEFDHVEFDHAEADVEAETEMLRLAGTRAASAQPADDAATTSSASEVDQFAERPEPAGDTTEAPVDTTHAPTSPPTEPAEDVNLTGAQPIPPEEPAEQTIVMPTVSASAARQAAREEVRHALIVGNEPPAEEQLADRYGRSKRWARDQVRAVRQELEQDSRRQPVGADHRS